jgi:hypothetical protein
LGAVPTENGIPPSRPATFSRREALRIGGAAALGAVLTGCAPEGRPARLLDHAVWGGYASTEPYPSCDAHFALERLLGAPLRRMSWFFNWSVPWPTIGGAQAASGGYDVLLAWQPQLDRGGRIPFADVLRGEYDGYLRRFFTLAGAHPGRVMIRLAHEMNGAGYPWALGYRHGPPSVTSASEFIATWRYVVDFGRRTRADNVSWQWCIMSADRGGVPAEEFYPGADHVDTLGMDIYNGYGGWQDPRAAISYSYRRLAALDAGKDLWISELGCREPRIREPGGADPLPERSKADWMRTLFDSTEFPRIAHVSFFHAKRAFDWRLDSHPDALDVCRTALAERTTR